MKRYKRSFASDNNSIVHPKIMEALNNVNNSHVLSYGDDPMRICPKAIQGSFRAGV